MMIALILHDSVKALTMSEFEFTFPFVYHLGKLFVYERTDGWAPSYFGGPAGVRITGVRRGSKSLHHVLTLSCVDIPVLERAYLPLPLFYGFCYSGCTLMYRLTTSKATITQLDPRESTAEWPYRHYPDLLPYFSMKIARVRRCSFRDFCKLSPQRDYSVAETSLIVVVPPIPNLGVSLWGPMGDGEGVQVVFEYDVGNRTIRAFNQCT